MSGSGVSTGSIRSRRCSNAGGSERCSPSESRLVGREARPERRDLEQDAAGLAEVDRAEVEAVDHGRGVDAGGAHALAPASWSSAASSPRPRGARCRRPGRPRPRAAGRVRSAPPRASPRASQPARRRARSRARSSSSGALASGRARRRARASKPCSASSAGISGCRAIERRVGALARPRARAPGPRGRRSRRLSPARSPATPSPPSRSAQKSRASLEPTRETMRCTMPGAGPARDRARVLEERDVGAGAAELVRVEQVVDGRIVLVDGLLDHPEAQHARVEVDVAGRVAGDRRDVMDAFELHVAAIIATAIVPSARLGGAREGEQFVAELDRARRSTNSTSSSSIASSRGGRS